MVFIIQQSRSAQIKMIENQERVDLNYCILEVSQWKAMNDDQIERKPKLTEL